MTRLLRVVLIVAAVATAGHAIADDLARPAGLPDPVTDAHYYHNGKAKPAKVELGRLLFYDKILSGNRNISCATCHHSSLGTSDGVPLGLGEGARGLGPDREHGRTEVTLVHGRVPRNSPGLWNLGAAEFRAMFHDGRVETDTGGYYDAGFITPAKWKLPVGLDNVLAAQAMFPVTSPIEMAGQKGENAIADARALNNVAGFGGVWQQLALRLRAVPQYVELFKAAYPQQVVSAGDIDYVLAANAIAAFEAESFRSDDSPFDRYLRGETGAMSRRARRGMALFYGEAGCSSCHSGAFQTDHEFHAIAMPQLGPGKGDGNDASYWSASGEKAFVEDFGRAHVTVRPEDQYKFRTPSLRNVALTAPYGHAGAYATLEQAIRHHLDPVGMLHRYRVTDDYLPELHEVLELSAAGSRLGTNHLSGSRLEGFLLRDRWVQQNDRLRARIAAANELEPASLTEAQIEDLVAFLESLTDPSARDRSHLVPDVVPSGLPVAD